MSNHTHTQTKGMFDLAEEWLLCVAVHGGSYFTTPETVMANLLDTFIVWVAWCRIFHRFGMFWAG